MKVSRKIAHNWVAIDIHNNFFRKILPTFKGVVVDLGCGTMPYRQEILAQGCEYIGVDWPNSIHGVNPTVASDQNQGVNLPGESADVVISFSVLEHLHSPAAMLSESWRILKPGAPLYIEVPFQWHVHEAPHDYYRYTRFGLMKLLNDAGFEEVEISPNGGFWTTFALKFNYQSTRWIRGPKPLRLLARVILLPVWFLDQTLAKLLDRIDFNDGHTPSYTTVARKPMNAAGVR